MELDTSKLFNETRNVEATVQPMGFPFLLRYAFNDRGFNPDALRAVLVGYCEAVADQAKPDQLKDMLRRSFKVAVGEHDPLGMRNLPIAKLSEGYASVNTVVGVTGTRIELRRYGDCLGIRPINDRHELHEKMAAVFDQMTVDRPDLVSHFMHRYGFTISPLLKERRDERVLNMQDEMASMSLYLPDIKWYKSVGMALTLGDDFTHQQEGLSVGTYGDAKVYLRITFSSPINDATWRHGLISEQTGTEIVFRGHGNFRPRLEYFVRTEDPDNSYDPAPLDIDYQREQGLLGALARMLYAGLYQREFQSAVKNGNKSWIRFRNEPGKVAI